MINGVIMEKMAAATKLHRQKLCGLFEENQSGVIYLKGAEMSYRYGTDYEFPFRQESGFLYVSGINEPDYHLLIDLKSNEYHLFTPERDAQFAVWHGRIRPEDEIRELYRPDHLHYDTSLLTVLRDLSPEVIYCLNDDQASFIDNLDPDFNTDSNTLNDALSYCRLHKSRWELDQMRTAARINNAAHREVLTLLKPGLYEYEMKAAFEFHHVRHGLTQDAYNGIHASGPNSAILHYVSSDRRMKDGDLYLIDAGFEYLGYASDVTRTYPVNGQFSDIQRAVYNVVLKAHSEAINQALPGVKMEDLHLTSASIITDGLRDIGLLKGSIDDLMENNIFALFFPHGLGHFLGLDTHDVGGYPDGVDRIDRPGLRYLRVRRDLQPGMVITIEPGIYFIPALLRPAFDNSEQNRFLNVEKLEPLLNFGGIRIENNLIIHEDRNEDLTDVPLDPADIEW